MSEGMHCYWQFTLSGRIFGPLRPKQEEAIADAIRAGYGCWDGDEPVLDWNVRIAKVTWAL